MGLTETARRVAGPVKWISLAAIVLALLLLGSVLPLGRAVEALRGWIDGLGIWGPAVFVAIYAVATVLMLPGLILTLAAGAIFGLVTGTIAVSIGSVTGAALAFLIARYVAREKVAQVARERPRFGAIDRAIAEGGWKIVAMLRLSPAIPFNLQNYLYGLTPIRFWTCVLTSWIAMLPGTFMYVYVGHITGAVAGGERQRTIGEWALLGVGLLATVAVTIYITKLATRKLSERTEIAPEDEAAKQTASSTEDDAAASASGWPWGATVTALVAVLALSAAAYARLNPQTVQTTISGLFGPPAVEMAEAYEPRPQGPSFDHSTFDRLLRTHVDANGWIDYEGVRRDVATLDGYLASVAEAPFDELGRDEKLALLINAYNAYTLKLILNNWPVDKITNLDRPWKGPKWTVGGNVWTLDQIEHQEIRPKFQEPRIHFVLVCAAAGCPPLRNEAYTAERLERQLEAQTRYVHEHPTWARYDGERNTIHLTKLYDWYGGDFEQAAGSVLEYVGRYVPAVEAALESSDRPAIRWLDYDWSLNSVANRAPR